MGNSVLVTMANGCCTLAGLLHAAFTIVRPVQPSIICPHPGHLSPMKFQWSLLTIVSIVCQILGGVIRVLAYEQLGKNFTYQLATPSGLVTGGLYKYVRQYEVSGVAPC
jgi:uncharacterized membrane protein